MYCNKTETTICQTSMFHTDIWHVCGLSLCVCVRACRGNGCLLLEGKEPVVNGLQAQSGRSIFSTSIHEQTAGTRVCTTSFVTSSLAKVMWVHGDRTVFRLFNGKRNALKTVCDPICQTTSEGGHIEHKCKCLQSAHSNSEGL